MDSRDERPFSYSVTGDYPVVMLLVPLILGILAANSLYSLLSSRLTLMVIVTVALALCFSLLLLLRQGRGMLVLTRLCLMATALSFGALLTVVSLRNVLVAFPAEKAVYGGVIVSEPRVRGGSVRMRVMTGGMWAGDRAMKRSGVVELTTVADSSTRNLAEGDAVIFEGIVRAPANAGNPYETDYASYLIHHGVGGTAFVYPDALKRASAAESVRLRERCLGAGYRARLWGDHVRMRLMDVYRSVGLTGGGLALVAAMTIGSKDLLTPATRSLFSEAGVSHVLALSGLHLSIIFAILELLLAGGMRTGRRARIAQVVIIAFVWSLMSENGENRSLTHEYQSRYDLKSTDIDPPGIPGHVSFFLRCRTWTAQRILQAQIFRTAFSVMTSRTFSQSSLTQALQAAERQDRMTHRSPRVTISRHSTTSSPSLSRTQSRSVTRAPGSSSSASSSSKMTRHIKDCSPRSRPMPSGPQIRGLTERTSALTSYAP